MQREVVTMPDIVIHLADAGPDEIAALIEEVRKRASITPDDEIEIGDQTYRITEVHSIRRGARDPVAVLRLPAARPGSTQAPSPVEIPA